MTQLESFDDSHTITLVGSGPAVTSRLLKPGDVVGGSYRLKSLLGHGGMGYVFCAEHTMIKRDYALKMIAPGQLDEASRRRFEIEGRAIANLDHANIIKVYNMGLDAGDCPFYVMDLLDGQALSEYITANQGIALEECLEITSQIAAGLGYAHGKGIVHRDVKPSNIILVPDGSGRIHVKIVDFGIAKLLPSANLHNQSQTAIGAVFGSPLYMSPEQSMGTTVDQRSDIYSLGCTLFEALCGWPPYRGQNAMQTMMMHQEQPIPSILEARPGEHWPQSVDVLLSKTMAKLPKDRYQSMDQLRHDIDRLKQGKTIGAVVSEGPAVAQASLSPNEPDEEQGPSNEQSGLMSPARALSLILLVLIMASLVLYGISQRGGGKNLQEAQSSHTNQTRLPFVSPIRPNTESLTADPREVKAAQAFANCRSIKSTEVRVDGALRKQFVFPDWSIGRVTNLDSLNGLYGLNVDARGVQAVPPGVPLTLEIGIGNSVEVLRSPGIIEKIKPGEFEALLIDGRTLQNAEEVSETSSKITGLDRLLKAPSHWSKLRRLTLENLTITKDQFELIDKYPHLTEFRISSTQFDPLDLAKQPFLKRLQSFALTDADNIGPICGALKDSEKLNKIQLSKCHSTPGQLAPLLGNRHLQQVGLEESDFRQLVPCLSEHHYFGTLCLIGQKLSPKEIGLITSCPNITVVNLKGEDYLDTDTEPYKGHNKVHFLPSVKKQAPL